MMVLTTQSDDFVPLLHQENIEETQQIVENDYTGTPRHLHFQTHLNENESPRFLNKLCAEFIATYLLVFVTCGSAAVKTIDASKVPGLGASMAAGLIVTVMISAVGHISGGHMNPAVTLAFSTFGHFPWKQVPCYVAAQVVGATFAGLTLRFLLNPIQHLGTTSPSESNSQALIMELVTSFSLMFITYAVATDYKIIGEHAGIAVGSAVCSASILAGPISGGSMNPARTIGPAIANNYYRSVWIYLVGPICGTLLGGWTYILIVSGSDLDRQQQSTSNEQTSVYNHLTHLQTDSNNEQTSIDDQLTELSHVRTDIEVDKHDNCNRVDFTSSRA